MQNIKPLPSSYRDPSGFMYEKDGVLFRQVNRSFKTHYDLFIQSGCYPHLSSNEMLVSHEETDVNHLNSSDHYKTLKPELIPFISYPYEWCFDMLKNAALLTLKIVKESLPFGLILKDATPFNVQWRNGKPIFIDSLSFEQYDPLRPWIAYRQFIETFLSPLLLMHYTRKPLQPLMLAYPDGIPLSITKSLLPFSSRFSIQTYLHIHLHATVSGREKGSIQKRKTEFSEKKLKFLIGSLESLTASLKWNGEASTWGKYYDEASLRDDYLQQKENIISSWLDHLPGLKTCVDLGANDGRFSFHTAKRNIKTISTDFDHNAINNLYNKIKKDTGQSRYLSGSSDLNDNIRTNILPLIMDLSNPSPAIGVNNHERESFTERTNADLLMALALIHHLAIGKNIPFEKVAELISQLGEHLIIEWVPKEDAKVKLMLTHKKDIYFYYTQESFISEFSKYFSIISTAGVGTSGRTLYLMKRSIHN